MGRACPPRGAAGGRGPRGGGGAQARGDPQPLKGGHRGGGALADEMKVLKRDIKLTPELAARLLDELDMSTPMYYTRKKRRDPFVDL